MSQIFSYLSYRKLLSDRAKAWKKSQRGWTLVRLAEQTSIQPPYLTNVFKERAHLSSDQLYSVSQRLGLNQDEGRYVLLLMEWERSANIERKAELKLEIDKIQKQKLKTDAHLQAEKMNLTAEELTRFYINPDLQLVYAFLGIKQFAENFELIAQSLQLSLEQVQACVHELQHMKFIEVTSQGIVKSKKQMHLPKHSPLCTPQQLLLHYRSLQQVQSLPLDHKYNFAVTFTGDEPTKERIQREFLSFLKKVEHWVKEAPSEGVYQMHFDLFNWSRHLTESK